MQAPPLDQLWQLPTQKLAPTLLAYELHSIVNGKHVSGLIYETEAYVGDDPASHSFRGPTPRNQAMFGEPGTIYVYRSYGIHWCVNFVSEPVGEEAAVLIRALLPLTGQNTMSRRRGRTETIIDGPGKVTQALAITSLHNRLPLNRQTGIWLEQHSATIPEYQTLPRIGISQATEYLWRFRRTVV